jgi:hypothetical protein
MSKQPDNEDEKAPHFSQVPFTPLSPKERARRAINSDPDDAIATIQDHLKRRRGDPSA